jgi:regulation of enolase protein 1 (concanavalin A-like superfamily)
MRRGATYVLLYSANDFRSADYAVGYATAPSPLGPWRKAPRNPVLAQSSRLRGPGCLGLVPSPDGAELWAYYHVHVARDGYLRQLAIDRAQVVPDAEMGVRVTIAGPTESTQALPAGAPEFPVGTSDEFGGALNPRRWEVIDEAPGAWAVRDGKLHLLTLDGDMFQGRADYRNLFLQRAPQGDFAITARAFVSSGIEYEQAFICVWQDADNYLRLSSTFAGRRVLDAAIEVDGQYVSTQQPQPGAGPVELRITRRGDVYSFAYRETGPAWVEVGPPRTAAFSDLKMGLGAISPGSTQRRPAWFDYFRLTAPGGAEP